MSPLDDPEPAAGPDTEPETLPDAVAETMPGHAGVPTPTTAGQPQGTAPPPTGAPPQPAWPAGPSAAQTSNTDVESATRVTKGGTQISSFSGDDTHTTLDSTDRALSLGSNREPERPISSALVDERFRDIERRLDRIDARMRLLEKGAEQGSNGRTTLVWWMAVLAAVVVWALLSRLR